MRAAWRILKAETLHVVTQLAKRRGGSSSTETRADDDDSVFPLVRRVDELHLETMPIPLSFERTAGNSRVELHESAYQSEKDSNRHSREAEPYDHRNGHRDRSVLGIAARLRCPNRSHGAPRSVIEVQAEREHRHYVEEHDPPDAEAHYDVRENVALLKDSFRPPARIRKVHDVQRNEHQEQHGGPAHGARSPRAHLRLALHVTQRPCGAVLHRQLISGDDVQDHSANEHEPQNPEQLACAREKVRVGVDRFGAAECKQVSRHVKHDEAHTDQARHTHHDFFPYRGTVKAAQPVHRARV